MGASRRPQAAIVLLEAELDTVAKIDALITPGRHDGRVTIGEHAGSAASSRITVSRRSRRSAFSSIVSSPLS